ncbi:MAG: branched-chain amino acid ABC transporter permease [Desulfovibrio sp.]|nr:branched-chain amino acid ABC transporter permease [Desulfovibrio sp.]
MIFFQYLVGGLAVGMVYALMAIGYSIVFGILQLINLSHSAVYAFGAQIFLVYAGMSFGIPGALIASIATTGLLSAFIEFTALRPLRKKEPMPVAGIITTMGSAYIIQNLLNNIFGSDRKLFPDFYNIPLNLDNLPVTPHQLILFTSSLLLLIGLTLIVNRSKLGFAMQAVQQNQGAAALMGINTNFVISFAFFLSGASAAIAGVLIGGYYQVAYPMMGSAIGMKAFSASVLGGIGEMRGAALGGLLVGAVEGIVTGYLGGAYKDAISFIILIAVLIFKPEGLFGKKAISKV